VYSSFPGVGSGDQLAFYDGAANDNLRARGNNCGRGGSALITPPSACVVCACVCVCSRIIQSEYGPTMEETKVIYHIDDEDTPYLVKLPIAADKVTLADFKNVLNRPNYKFFFKSMDDDFGLVIRTNRVVVVLLVVCRVLTATIISYERYIATLLAHNKQHSFSQIGIA